MKLTYNFTCNFTGCGGVSQFEQYVAYPTQRIPVPTAPRGWISIGKSGVYDIMLCPKHEVRIGPVGKKHGFGSVEDLTSYVNRG